MDKISFCTVCMNRLHQLKQTLSANIQLFEKKKNIEFVLLDYNSQDGLDEWVINNMSAYLESGLLVYFRTNEPQTFSHSHSKNMAFRLASGQILCSINADHFIGSGFDDYLLLNFKKYPKSFISPYIPDGSTQKYIPPKDVVGKVCVTSADFYRVSGFDEKFKNYGFEDVDFVKRLEASGVKRIVLNDLVFLQYIEHGDDERVQQKKPEGLDIYVNYISPSETEVLYLDIVNNRYECVVFRRLSNLYSHKYIYSFKARRYTYDFIVKKKHWKKGEWKREGECIYLNESNIVFDILLNHDSVYLRDVGSGKLFIKLMQAGSMITFNTMLSFVKNLSYMRHNVYNKRARVNNSKFGIGKVYKNFCNEGIEIR